MTLWRQSGSILSKIQRYICFVFEFVATVRLTVRGYKKKRRTVHDVGIYHFRCWQVVRRCFKVALNLFSSPSTLSNEWMKLRMIDIAHARAHTDIWHASEMARGGSTTINLLTFYVTLHSLVIIYFICSFIDRNQNTNINGSSFR